MKFAWTPLLFLIGLTAFGQESFPLARAGHEVKVWYHLPAGASASAPVIFVLHGIRRNAADYLRDWTGLSDQRGFLLVVPEFSQAQYPDAEGYIYGNTVDKSGAPLPPAAWSFSMIEPAFDAVKARTGNVRPRYSLYGHSAGAQFVQRFVYFVPKARLERAVAANAGWYMLPRFDRAFPYGLRGTPVTEEDLRHAFGLPLTILLGTEDTDSRDPVLRHTPEADAQGRYRLARGQYFFREAAAAARASGAPFAWALAKAPGIGHSDPGMAPFAAADLLAR